MDRPHRTGGRGMNDKMDLDPSHIEDFQEWLKEPECRQVAEQCLGLNTLTAERDRYRDAVRAIGQLPWCETCAPGYNAIVRAALDGEG